MTTIDKPTTKAVFFYARKGSLVKLKPQKHPLVTGFLKERERQIIRWYSKHIADEFTTCFPEYTITTEDFERVQRELETTEDKIVVFLHDMFHPIVRMLHPAITATYVQDK